MQQNQPGRRFADVPQQPVYRFPQNQSAQGWQPQQTFPSAQPSEPKLSRRDRRTLDRRHKKHRRIFTWWNLFAVIGIILYFILSKAAVKERARKEAALAAAGNPS